MKYIVKLKCYKNSWCEYLGFVVSAKNEKEAQMKACDEFDQQDNYYYDSYEIEQVWKVK